MISRLSTRDVDFDAQLGRLLAFEPAQDAAIEDAVTEILAQVKLRGDSALLEFTRKFDQLSAPSVSALELDRATIERARAAISAAQLAALEQAARRIRTFHEHQVLQSWSYQEADGTVLGQRVTALERIGMYVPGGKAAYPSTVLMNALPAKVAGVGEIIMTVPTPRGERSDLVLAAASVAGVDRVFTVGGAQAIAALAYGTQTIPAVDKIVGPGNAYVSEAKVQLTSEVGIDSPAGPSELVVIADDSADPIVIAREVNAQAEHDSRAIVIVFAVGREIARRIESAIADDVKAQPRVQIILASLAKNGGVLFTETADEAVSAANQFAPEHLLIATRNAGDVARSTRSAGSVFVGETSSVAFGDYMTGANHVLPTGGMARCYSGLSTLDFVRWTTLQTVTREAAGGMSLDTELFALAEGLAGHASAARGWSNI